METETAEDIRPEDFDESAQDLQRWSDDKLHLECCRYGDQALKWRRKFIGLLVEVNRRGLFEKKGFSSIFEYGKKLAGLSEEQIRLALNLEKRFSDKPTLRAALVNGEVSLHKLERVAFVATPENEEQLADQVKLLPKKALETLVRDIRFENRNGFIEPKNESKFTPGRGLRLSAEVTQKLLELQQKGFDINELILKLLKDREERIATEKAMIAEEMSEKAESATRHKPAKVVKILREEHGTICIVRNCNRPAVNIHHTDRFGLNGRHNPYYMAPVCLEHHQIAHSIDVKVQEKRREALRR